MDAIYLDHAATTPLRPEVVRAMEPFSTGLVGNPSSVHRWGRAARRTLEEARERVAAALRGSAEEIRFVRGGTEAANLALSGAAAAFRARGTADPVFLGSPVEHSSVRETLSALSATGVRVRTLEWDRDAGLALPTADELTRSGVSLVSCQWVNPEAGVILPVPELASVAAEAGIPMHVDGVQAAGHVPLELDRTPISLLGLSGHKIGGPKGAGALFIRRGTEIRPTLFGGPQERGFRPGTEDVAGAVGFAEALEIAVRGRAEETRRLTDLRDRLEGALRATVPELLVHGDSLPRSPHVLGLGVEGVPRDLLPGALDLEGVAASAGSACRSGSTELSPTLAALYGAGASFAPLRLSLGWTTTGTEVEAAAAIVAGAIRRAREARSVGAA